MFKKLLVTFCLISISAIASERMYIDEKELDHKDFCYHIHIGDNIWIETKAVHMNPTGMFTYERDVIKDSNKEYEKRWKCPYCNRYWKIGQACQNADCPSRYK